MSARCVDTRQLLKTREKFCLKLEQRPMLAGIESQHSKDALACIQISNRSLATFLAVDCNKES